MVYAAAGILALSLVAGAFWWSQSGDNLPSGKVAKRSPDTIAEPDDTFKDETEERAVLEHTKLVVQGILDIMSNSVSAFIERTNSYDSKLDTHREEIKRAVSLENIKAIEEDLISNLDRLQRTNAEYRKQLDEANKQLAAQATEMERLKIDVTTDFLTGLPNRRAFDDRLRENVDRSNRYGTKCSMIVMDIDHFKKVNDTHGHVAGDRVIRAIARSFSEQMRSTDFLARYGGEEFVVILPETDAEHAIKTAERMRVKVEGSVFKYGDAEIQVTVSLGVGEVYQPEDTPENFFERVDQALYKAKQSGRNNVQSTL